MPRRELALTHGSCYHLCNRGADRGPIFFERANYLFFLERLRRYLLPVSDIIAYCLMPNHYHLLIQFKEGDLSHAMMLLGISYTKSINTRRERVGPLFQGAFRARLVDGVEYLLHLSRYLHVNPVRSRLASRAEGWEFSSYRDYLGLRAGTLPHPAIVISQFPSVAAYRDFVESYLEEDREFIASLL